MADKKPLRISDDLNDLNPQEFAATDTVGIDDGGTGASTANDALNNLLPSQAGNSGKILQTDGTNTSWEEAAGGDGVCEDVNQTAHGLSVGDVVRSSSGAWVKAQADTAANSEALAIVTVVPDVDNFTICYSGRINGLSGLTPDNVYFLSDSVAGGLTATEPTGISKPILYATSATSAVLLIMRALDSPDVPIVVEDEGVQVESDTTKFNFVGSGVTVTNPVAGEVEVTIPEGSDNLGNHTATESLKMQDFPIENPSRVDYQEDAAKPAHLEGRTFYDKDEHTLAVYNEKSDVTHQLGQEGLTRVYNNSGALIPNGSVVYSTGGEDTEKRMTVALARADALSTSRIIGITTCDIPNNDFGYATTWGNINDLNLSAYSEGDILYLSTTTAGGYQGTRPNGTDIPVPVGYVVHNGTTDGRLFVHIRGVDDPRTSKPTIVLIFMEPASPYRDTNSSTYDTIAYFEYAGSSEIFTPEKITAVLGGGASGVMSVRIYDSTNAQTIAELTSQSVDSTATLYNLGAVSNIPTGPAVFEVQIRKDGGSGSMWISGVTLS